MKRKYNEIESDSKNRLEEKEFECKKMMEKNRAIERKDK